MERVAEDSESLPNGFSTIIRFQPADDIQVALKKFGYITLGTVVIRYLTEFKFPAKIEMFFLKY